MMRRVHIFFVIALAGFALLGWMANQMTSQSAVGSPDAAVNHLVRGFSEHELDQFKRAFCDVQLAQLSAAGGGLGGLSIDHLDVLQAVQLGPYIELWVAAHLSESQAPFSTPTPSQQLKWRISLQQRGKDWCVFSIMSATF